VVLASIQKQVLLVIGIRRGSKCLVEHLLPVFINLNKENNMFLAILLALALLPLVLAPVFLLILFLFFDPWF